jgi:uncharacterized protein
MVKSFVRAAALLLCVASAPLMAQTQKQAAAPTQEQLDIARKLVVDSGMSRTFSSMVLQTMGQINSTVTATRPELINDMRTVLNELQPELMKSTDKIIGGAANIFAALMSEQDLKEADTFFSSNAGKKYVDAQPNIFANLAPMIEGWNRENSIIFMARVREEMKKKGHDI